MLADLADVARRAGLRVVEVPGWRTRGHGPMQAPRTVTLHHTAGSAAGDAPSLAVVRDGRRDLAGPLAHYLLARSGVVHVVAAGLCWHTGATHQPWQANPYAVGVEAEHTGREQDPWPPAQIQALRRLARALCDHYDIPHARVLGHREIASPAGRKVDPVLIDLRAFRNSLSTLEEDTMPTAEQLAAAVWAHRLTNGFGDVVQAQQILVATEARVADAQTRLAALEQRLAQMEAHR